MVCVGFSQTSASFQQVCVIMHASKTLGACLRTLKAIFSFIDLFFCQLGPPLGWLVGSERVSLSRGVNAVSCPVPLRGRVWRGPKSHGAVKSEEKERERVADSHPSFGNNIATQTDIVSPTPDPPTADLLFSLSLSLSLSLFSPFHPSSVSSRNHFRDSPTAQSTLPSASHRFPLNHHHHHHAFVRSRSK
jgi:hypothetical protein